MTSNKRDFTPMKSENNTDANNKMKEFVKASKIVLGCDPSRKRSNYQEQLPDPKDQQSKFNYDKINFRYDPYTLNTITQEPIYKPVHENWSFDYYNKDKAKNYISGDKAIALNINYRKVYDPLTGRYLN